MKKDLIWLNIRQGLFTVLIIIISILIGMQMNIKDTVEKCNAFILQEYGYEFYNSDDFNIKDNKNNMIPYIENENK